MLSKNCEIFFCVEAKENKPVKQQPQQNAVDLSVLNRYKLSPEMLAECEEPDQVRSWDEIFMSLSNKIEKLEDTEKICHR